MEPLHYIEGPPQILATRSLKCRGKWVSVTIHAPAHARGPAPFYVCKLLFENGESAIDVGLSVPVYHIDDPAVGQKVDHWLPRRALMAAIDVLCGQLLLPDTRYLAVDPSTGTGFDDDPQKKDVLAFRKRCRYDILRVIDERLRTAQPLTFIKYRDLGESPFLTRLYEWNDLKLAASCWQERGFLRSPTTDSIGRADVNRHEELAEELAKYDWEEATAPVTSAQAAKYDVFICHASEDKDAFVRPLAEALQAKGLTVWYDEFSLTVGDHLRRSIDRGLGASRFGIVVLSHPFFEKDWPQYELDGLVQKEIGGHKVILPGMASIVKMSLRTRLLSPTGLPRNRAMDWTRSSGRFSAQ